VADSKLEFEIVGRAESAVRAFTEVGLSADAAARMVEKYSRKQREAEVEGVAATGVMGLVQKAMMGLAGAGGGGKGGEASFLETFGSSFGGLATGALVAAPAIAAVVTEVVALASGLVAATAGAGAFAALALPSLKILQTNYSQLVQNQNDFGNASQAIATSIHTSAADAAQYQKSIADPSTRAAVEVLNNQNTAWQNLTPSMQNALVALSNNHKAMANLLPDQKTALGILLKEQDAWSNLTPSQQTAVGALDQIRQAYDKMSLAFQPTAFKIFGDALQVVSHLMPLLTPLATAFGNAIGGLLGKLDKFVQSKGFHEWFEKLLKIVGPATTAFGDGIGKVLIAFGKLITVMSSHDVVHAINILFDVVGGFFNVMASWIRGAMKNWDEMSHDIAAWYHDTVKWLTRAQTDVANWAQAVDNFVGRVRHAWDTATGDVRKFEDSVFHVIGDVVRWFADLPGKIIAALASLGDKLFTAGKNAVRRLIDGLGSMLGGLGSMAGSLASKVAGFFGLSPAKEGPLSGGGAPEIRGAHFADSLASGMRSRLASLAHSADILAGGMGLGFPAQAGAGGGGQLALVMQMLGGEGPITNAIMEAIRVEAHMRGGGSTNSVQIAFGSAH